MGKAAASKPARLPAKLLTIRRALGLSQNGLIRHFGVEDQVTQSDVSAFERGKRLPPLGVLLKYSRSIGLTVDILIDDQLKLPKKLTKR
jgi:transcriptional regulator with XRE-family HTH domain